MKSILLLIVACVLINMVTCIPSASEVRESIEAMKKVIEIKKIERENAEKIELANKYNQYCLLDKERKDRSEAIVRDIVNNLLKGENTNISESVFFDDSICVFVILASSNFSVIYHMQDETIFVSVECINFNASRYFITHQFTNSYQNTFRYFVEYGNNYNLLKYYFEHYNYNHGISLSTNFIARQFNLITGSILGDGY